MKQPYILARTMKEAHGFARETLGLQYGSYRIVNSPSTIKSVRGAELYLVPGYQNRFDRFAMKGAIRWTRMTVIDVAVQGLPVAEPEPVEPEPVTDGLEPAGVQITIDEMLALNQTSNGDNMVAEGGPAEPEPEAKPKAKRRSRCKECGLLHFKDEPCPEAD